MPKPQDPAEYAKQLENVLAQCLQPLKGVPFKAVIRAIAKCAVLDFNSADPTHRSLSGKISEAAELAGREALTKGIFTARPNEAGNHIEPFVRDALVRVKLDAKTPVTAAGKAKAVGYPDVEIAGEVPCYLECKTYNIKNIETTMRAFYFSPSKEFKVTRDALHLLLAYQLESVNRGNKQAFVPIHWRLITLQDLLVDLKHEFNASNRDMYGSEAAKALIAEGDIRTRRTEQSAATIQT